jgi:glyoxylase-like metal-dependent hydrolase (beta-lactamase superfamily II)
MEPAKLEQMRPHLDSFIPLVSPQPELQIVRPEDEFRWGDQTFRAIETSGHAAGHLCFYNERENVMICGDHVLPQITPNVSLLPGSDPDPLHSFLTGLNQLRTYEVRCAFPGHRDPFSRWTERIDQIVRHHDERLARIIDLLDRPATAYMVCVKLFGEQLSTHQLRFAMSETLAHLVYLKYRGKIKEHDGEDVCYYSANV